MGREASQESFERVNLEGRNIGAAMLMRRGSRGESHDCCCINIYINNNIQGVNNSTLHGSEVKMRDPGVSLYIGDVKLNSRSPQTNRKTMWYVDKLGVGVGCCLKFLFVIILLFLFIKLMIWIVDQIKLRKFTIMSWVNLAIFFKFSFSFQLVV